MSIDVVIFMVVALTAILNAVALAMQVRLYLRLRRTADDGA